MLWVYAILLFLFKQKTAYEMRISDWSSDVCSTDLPIKRSEDVIPHLGSPTHWQPGRSAKSVADSWFGANGIPASVASVISGDPVLSGAILVDAFLERSTDLGDGGRAIGRASCWERGGHYV